MEWTGFAPGEVVLFDLDDTLIADTAAVEECWQRACEEAASRCDLGAGELRGAIREVGGWYWSDPERHRVGRHDLLAATRLIVRESIRRLGVLEEELAETLAVRYRALRDERMTLLEGARQTLDTLRTAGHRLGLITNGAGAAQRAKLVRFDLGGSFDYIGIEGELGVGKPDPEAYRRALDALGARAHEAWMVGDNLVWDVLAPKQLGLRAIWIDHAGRGLPDPTPVVPDHVAPSVAALVAAHPRDIRSARAF